MNRTRHHVNVDAQNCTSDRMSHGSWTPSLYEVRYGEWYMVYELSKARVILTTHNSKSEFDNISQQRTWSSESVASAGSSVWRPLRPLPGNRSA